jgi:uncharacterized protein (TIGR02391 family)
MAGNCLFELIPDVDALLALTPAELAPTLLHLAKQNKQSGSLMHKQDVAYDSGGHQYQQQGGYPAARRPEVAKSIAEAWNWLLVNSLVVPAEGTNGSSGFVVLSRTGEALSTERDFSSFRAAAAFPKALLHPTIADKVWTLLARGELADGVFTAFRAVEIAVREAGKFELKDIGVKLMRDAFDPKKGPLTDFEQPDAEREALCHLFAGAIGSYKNPHSHRTVEIIEPLEAQHMVILASHLLTIVETRSK